jgi:hypothetical protein
MALKKASKVCFENNATGRILVLSWVHTEKYDYGLFTAVVVG